MNLYMKKYKIGVIGGSGIYTLKNYKVFASNTSTDHKSSKSPLEKYSINGHEIYFVSRHGIGHVLLPHEIDYKKLIENFSNLRVDFIISFCTVGSLNKKYRPGDYIVPIDIIDFTHGRIGSKYTLDNKHVDTKPLFNAALVELIKNSFDKVRMDFINDGILGVIEGPRFATYAEQKMFKKIGCDFLNMTQMPETYLAHVFSIPYISLCHVTDFTTTVDKRYNINSRSAIVTFKSNVEKIEKILSSVLGCLDEDNFKILRNSKNNTFV